MKHIIALVALLALAGCQIEEPLLGGTVVSVMDAERGDAREESSQHYEHPLAPEAGWRVEVQLDDGSAVTVDHNGSRRYEPGERVRLLVGEDGRLLL